MIICVIPARGGSKRIKNKNIKIFNGKPIISQTLEKIKKSNIFDEIIVSSDSKKILDISKKSGVTPYFRSKNLSKDNVPTSLVVVDVINNLKEQGKKPIKICCIYPTSVFFKELDLVKANKMLTKKVNFIFSAVKYNHPIQRSFYKKKNKIIMNYKKTEKIQTQKFSVSYYDAAQFYFGWCSAWEKKLSFFKGKNKFIEYNELMVQDIDNNDDWQKAKIKFNFLNKR